MLFCLGPTRRHALHQYPVREGRAQPSVKPSDQANIRLRVQVSSFGLERTDRKTLDRFEAGSRATTLPFRFKSIFGEGQLAADI